MQAQLPSGLPEALAGRKVYCSSFHLVIYVVSLLAFLSFVVHVKSQQAPLQA